MSTRKPLADAASKDTKPPSDEDEYLALLLLQGIVQKNSDGTRWRHFLSKDTQPTEDEARAALARLLLSKQPLRPLVLWALASLFAPDGFSPPDSRRPPKWMFLSLRERRLIFCPLPRVRWRRTK